MEKFAKELELRHRESLSKANYYTKLLIFVIGLFVAASVLMKYSSDISSMINPEHYAKITMAQSSVPSGYWSFQTIGQIGLAVLAIYFGQVIATFSKYFHQKAAYYERLILSFRYSEATSDFKIFENEFTNQADSVRIGEFPGNPLQAFTEAIKNKKSENKVKSEAQPKIQKKTKEVDTA